MGCRARRAQSALVRWALAADGTVVLSRTAPGRGAWSCPDNACVGQAIKRRGFDRAWRRAAPAGSLAAAQITFEELVGNMRDLSAAGTAADRTPEKG